MHKCNSAKEIYCRDVEPGASNDSSSIGRVLRKAVFSLLVIRLEDSDENERSGHSRLDSDVTSLNYSFKRNRQVCKLYIMYIMGYQ